MKRKKIKVPQTVSATFLNVARGNIDSEGKLIETLCFLVGHETSNELIVTDIVFPVQKGSGAKVDDHGICGEDSSLWMRHQSPAGQLHQDNFRIIAWVHSHVRGALCGFSSVDVHTQYMYNRLCQGWTIYGLVYEINQERSGSISSWLDLTDVGRNMVSQCSTTHQQHEACSEKNFYQSFDNLVQYCDLPLAVVDARNTCPLGGSKESSQKNREPVIHKIFDKVEQPSLSFDICQACGKYTGTEKAWIGHVGHKKSCKMHYGSTYTELQEKRRFQSKKAYQRENSKKLAERQLKRDRAMSSEKVKKQAKYNKENAEEIARKQARYDEKNAEQVRTKQTKYNKENADNIARKQAKYNEKNAEQVRTKQTKYNKENADNIARKQAKYNEKNADQVRKKQAKYNKENADDIARKQAKYDEKNADQVRRKQAKYNKENADEIARKQAKYNEKNENQVRREQAK